MNEILSNIAPAIKNNLMFIIGTLILMLTFRHLISKK